MPRDLGHFIQKLLSGIRDKNGRSLADVLEGATADDRNHIHERIREELGKPPKIAIIGKRCGKEFHDKRAFWH